jgi:hypothetical protein
MCLQQATELNYVKETKKKKRKKWFTIINNKFYQKSKRTNKIVNY